MSTPTPILQYSLSTPTMQSLLPSGYTPLVYLQSDGTQWINSGIALNSSTSTYRFECKVGASTRDGHAHSFFGTSSYQTGMMGIYHYTNNTYYSEYIQNANKGTQGLTIAKGDVFEYYLQMNMSAKTYASRIAYASEVTGSFTAMSNTTDTIRVFKSDDYPGGYWKCYYFRIIKDNVSAVDLRPARRDSDGVIGMYDLVSRSFKTNSGSGTFIAGPPLAVGKGGGKSLPEEYQQVEYIRIPGGGGINTGVTVTSGTKFVAEHVMTFQQLSSNSRDTSGYNGSASGYWEVGNGNKYGTYTTYSITAGTRDKIVFTKTAADGGNLVVNGTTSHSCGDGRTGTYTIGGVNGSYSGSRWKDVEYIKIWSADVLVRNMYACYRKSDMKPGMYDTVNGVFYTNSGSGEFVLGPSVTNYYSWEPNAGSGTQQGLYTNVSSAYDSSKGWVADFPGNPGRLICNTNPSFTLPLTVSCWIKFDVVNSNTQYAISYNANSGGTVDHLFGIGIYSSKLAFWSCGAVVQDITPTVNTWYHVTLVINSSKQASFYVNGIRNYQGTPGSTNISATAFWLGCRSSGEYYFDGKLQNVQIFNVALTDAQVKELYGQ